MSGWLHDAPIDFIYFDLDHTLWDNDMAERRALTGMAQRRDADPATLIGHYQRINGALWLALSQGAMDGETLRTERLYRTWDAMGWEPLTACRVEDVHEEYQLGYLDATAELADGLATIRALAADGWRLGILSNGFPGVQFRKLALLGLDNLGLEVVLSGDVGVPKPHPGIFKAAQQRAGVDDPSRLVIVGDNWDVDILGGVQAGWHGIWTPWPSHTHHDGAVSPPPRVTVARDWQEVRRVFRRNDGPSPARRRGDESSIS